MRDIVEEIKNDLETIRVVDRREKELTIDSNFIKLKAGDYTLNNGKVIYRESIGKKIGTGNAVCVFGVTRDHKIILVLQPRVVLEDETSMNVELPAGYIEEGEDPLQAGLRELEEETGFRSEEAFIVDEYYPSLGFSKERVTMILALDCDYFGTTKLDPGEEILVKSVTLKEFERLLNEGYMKDANARIGYYRYLEYLMKEGY